MASPTMYYVDPFINAASGSGTIGDPWGDLQYALNTITRDAINGDQLNIKAGTAEILAASLTLATYGAPAEGAPLVIRGYTSAANDGGIGEIDCNGVTFLAASTTTDFYFTDLEIHNFGNNAGINLTGLRTQLLRCEVHKGASTPSGKALVTGVNRVVGCYIHDAGTTGKGVTDYRAKVYYSYIYNCPTGLDCGEMMFNILHDCATAAISLTSDAYKCIGNSIYHSSASTGTGISVASGVSDCMILNNIIEGYSGTGGKGISSATDIGLLGYNAFYNNATAESLGDVINDLGGDVTLAASPFVNPGSGDFSPASASTAKEVAFPGAWYGPAGTTNKADIGAVQNGAGTGGSVRIIPALGRVGL